MITYLLSGKLLHLITVVEIVACIFLIPLLVNFNPVTIHELIIKYYLIGFLISLPVLSQLDGRSRYQNYKQLKDQFHYFGFDERILKPVRGSRCQRDAAITAARDAGFRNECKTYFIQCGYRWYHVFPDFVFTHPEFLFTTRFWKTTFFSPTYKPRYAAADNCPKMKGLIATFTITYE